MSRRIVCDRLGRTSLSGAAFMFALGFAVNVGLTGSRAAAVTILLSSADRGWYDQSGEHVSINVNYSVGDKSEADRDILRNFFVFDLSSVAGIVQSAVLRADNPSGGYTGNQPSETWTLYDVTTNIGALTGGGKNLISIYNDLGQGTSFGSAAVSSADNGKVVSVSLNSAGVADINAATGSMWALGGAISSLDSVDNAEQIFAFTSTDDRVELLLEVIPEPGCLWLVCMSCAALLSCLLRRRAWG